MHHSRLAGLVLVLGALAAAVSIGGCHRGVAFSPSLAPVDATRPIVRYKPIQGSACESFILGLIPTGGDLILDATWDMKRLEGADGYVEVSIDEHTYFWFIGYTTCVTVTGYPFTYGSEPQELRLRGAGGAPPATQPSAPAPREPSVAADPDPAGPDPADGQPLAPPRAAPAATAPRPPAPPPPPPPRPAPVTTDACAGFGTLAGDSPVIQRVVRDKCVARIQAGDERYGACVAAAAQTADVTRCNSLAVP